LARNRYGWQKRAKEMARKQKNEEKMKRRQGKNPTPTAEVMPEAVEEGTQRSGSDKPSGRSLRQVLPGKSD
jgi:hypothetical protein